MTSKIECKIFVSSGEMQSLGIAKAIADVNAWRDEDPEVRVINIETVMSASGGQAVFGQAV